MEGLVRLMVHFDPNKAVMWEVVSIHGMQYIRVNENWDGTAYFTKGWFVSVPPSGTRDELSNYLAVSTQQSDAMPVMIVPY